MTRRCVDAGAAPTKRRSPRSKPPQPRPTTTITNPLAHHAPTAPELISRRRLREWNKGSRSPVLTNPP